MRFNHATLFAAVAAAMPDRDAIVFRDRRLSYGDVAGRVNALANVLAEHGIGIDAERADLQPWETGQDLVALYLLNGNEYLEGMLGSAAARAASFNVNYRYVEAELAYLLDDAGAKAVIYHARFAPTLGAILDELRQRPVLLLQVADESGNELLPGALDYEAALAAASTAAPDTSPDPDDLYVVYTGGTTGMPKGVLWTQAEILLSSIAAFMPAGLFEVDTLDEAVELIEAGPARVVLPTPPLMHAAAQWVALAGILSGGSVVFPAVVDRLDAKAIWDVIDGEGVMLMNMVGNSFATPLMDEFDRGGRSGKTVQMMGTGGAILSAPVKQRILDALPHLAIADVAGSSETGSQLSNISMSTAPATSGVFAAAPGSCVVDDDHEQILEPGDPRSGWLGRWGAIPLGYLGDAEKTARTFPTIGDKRIAIPGDRARHLADGGIELLGRDSVTINSGGEKIYAEEVEEALIVHPGIADVVVVGRPSDRWGSEVVAVVAVADGHDPSDDELRADIEPRLARYKLPKDFVRVDKVLRSPAGKADYRWAKDIALTTPSPDTSHSENKELVP